MPSLVVVFGVNWESFVSWKVYINYNYKNTIVISYIINRSGVAGAVLQSYIIDLFKKMYFPISLISMGVMFFDLLFKDICLDLCLYARELLLDSCWNYPGPFGVASLWRVCYQRSLPRLVDLSIKITQ